MRKRMIEFVVLLAVALGASPVGAALWQWTKTAGPNDSADATINWREGMAPSAVNDSARAMMAAVAQYRDDISGLLATAGSSTAYTVTTNQGLAATPTDGQLLSVTVHATNGTAPSLTADGGTAYAIQSSPGVAVASGSLVLGSPYSMKFSTANSAWMLKGFYASATNVPLGSLIAYTGTTAPNSNFVFAAGQCLSTTTYATYWALVGSPASGACPGGQFAIIDMSGRVPAGLDTMPSFSAKNRLTNLANGCGTAMTTVGAFCVNGTENHLMTTAELVAHSHTIFDPGHIHTSTVFSSSPGNSFAGNSVGSVGAASTNSAVTNISINNTGGSVAFPVVQPTIGVTYLLRVL